MIKAHFEDAAHAGTAQELDSRESPTAANRPILTINFTAGSNQQPTLNAIPDPAGILEDAATQTDQSHRHRRAARDADAHGDGYLQQPGLDSQSHRQLHEPECDRLARYTPAANRSGTAVITVTVKDDGGTANGGINTITRTFTVTVTPVNHAPTLDPIPDPAAILEDAGQQTVNLTASPPAPATTQTFPSPPQRQPNADPRTVRSPTPAPTPRARSPTRRRPIDGKRRHHRHRQGQRRHRQRRHRHRTRTFTVTVTPVNHPPRSTRSRAPPRSSKTPGSRLDQQDITRRRARIRSSSPSSARPTTPRCSPTSRRLLRQPRHDRLADLHAGRQSHRHGDDHRHGDGRRRHGQWRHRHVHPHLHRHRHAGQRRPHDQPVNDPTRDLRERRASRRSTSAASPPARGIADADHHRGQQHRADPRSHGQLHQSQFDRHADLHARGRQRLGDDHRDA